MAGAFKIREILFKDFTELYITIPRGGVSGESLSALLGYLEERSALIAQAMLVGSEDSIAQYRGIISNVPLFALGDSLPGCGLCVRAIVLHAQPGADASFAYIGSGNDVIGCKIATETIELLSVVSRGAVGTDFRDEAMKEYGDIERAVHEHGFAFADVYRFWNYIENILEHYREFNAVRDQFFKMHEVSQYPAATGIGCLLANGKSVAVNAEAVRGSGVVAERLFSDMQCEAAEYGPKFSRAVALDFDGGIVTKVYVSGTSTIGKKGESVGDLQLVDNIEYTLRSISDLLQKKGMGLDDIVSAIVYGLDASVLDAFAAHYSNIGLRFPFVAVETTICRKELLFEMECIAARHR